MSPHKKKPPLSHGIQCSGAEALCREWPTVFFNVTRPACQAHCPQEASRTLAAHSDLSHSDSDGLEHGRVDKLMARVMHYHVIVLWPQMDLSPEKGMVTPPHGLMMQASHQWCRSNDYQQDPWRKETCSPLSVFSFFPHIWLVSRYDLPAAVNER